MSTLAPCPGCGQIEKLIVWRHSDHAALYSVSCQECGWRSPCLGTEEAAAKHWNRRAPTLRWRREPPDVPGWWWRQHRDDPKPSIAHYSETECADLQASPLNGPRWRWAGPIPAPEEAE